MLKVYFYDEPKAPIVDACAAVLPEGSIRVPSLEAADVAVASLLRRKLPASELAAPRLGVLIFHPSLLPVHRGRDAIKWAFRLGERYTGATWFWADGGLDTGDICEQEPLLIRPGESPREFYERAAVPAAARMLKLILLDLLAGVVRRRPQIAENATFEPPVASIPQVPDEDDTEFGEFYRAYRQT